MEGLPPPLKGEGIICYLEMQSLFILLYQRFDVNIRRYFTIQKERISTLNLGDIKHAQANYCR